MAFYGKKFLEFMRANKDIPHISKYHEEDYVSHVMMVILNVSNSNDRTLMLAAALHDIAKPRTCVLRPNKGATFYGHENITADELTEFLSMDDEDYDNVYDLIQAHMLPFTARGPEPFASDAIKKIGEFIKEHDSSVVAKLFNLNVSDAKSKVVLSEKGLIKATFNILLMADDFKSNGLSIDELERYSKNFWSELI